MNSRWCWSDLRLSVIIITPISPDIVSLWELSALLADERERESKILLVFAYSRLCLWPCLSWAKPSKPDKYNVTADLTYTSSDQMSGDNTWWFCSSGLRQQTWRCAARQRWRWYRRYSQGTKHPTRLTWLGVTADQTCWMMFMNAGTRWHPGTRHLMFMMFWTLLTTGVEQEPAAAILIETITTQSQTTVICTIVPVYHPPTQTLSITYVKLTIIVILFPPLINKKHNLTPPHHHYPKSS